ncbi:hypothetical protein M9458_026426, partial [Cirrhinus mrigala]
TDRSSPVPPSISPMPTPVKMSPPESPPPPLNQSPLILQPLASPLQVGVPPMLPHPCPCCPAPPPTDPPLKHKPK